MKRRGGHRSRIDWGGDGAPSVGDVVRRVSGKGYVIGYWRVTSVRLVRNRNPLPEGVSARYALVADFISSNHPGIAVDWTMTDYPRRQKPKLDPSTDRFSPLLHAGAHE